MNAWFWEVPAAAAIAGIPIAMAETSKRFGWKWENWEGRVVALAFIAYSTWEVYDALGVWWAIATPVFFALGIGLALGVYALRGVRRAIKEVRVEVKQQYGHGLVKQWWLIRRAEKRQRYWEERLRRAEAELKRVRQSISE